MNPPPGTPSGNHPEPVLHPRMNSRSVQRVSFNVRALLTLHTSCFSIVCYACLVFIVSSPPLLLSDSPDDQCRCPFDRLRRRRPCTPTVELPGKQSHFPSPSYRLSVFIILLH